MLFSRTSSAPMGGFMPSRLLTAASLRPQLDQVLRNGCEVPSLRGQGFDGGATVSSCGCSGVKCGGGRWYRQARAKPV